MNNTQLNLSHANAKKLLSMLDDVPNNKRDSVWHQLYNDIKKICDIWNNISVRKSSVSKIKEQS